MDDDTTFVLLKPDALERNLVGVCISRLEAAGLRIQRLHLLDAANGRAEHHYPTDDRWLTQLGSTVLAALGHDRPRTLNGRDTPIEIGTLVRVWLCEYLNRGPTVSLSMACDSAVLTARRVIGAGRYAGPGTIRSDLGRDTIPGAIAEGRALQNLVHSSDCPAEAAREQDLWFA